MARLPGGAFAGGVANRNDGRRSMGSGHHHAQNRRVISSGPADFAGSFRIHPFGTASTESQTYSRRGWSVGFVSNRRTRSGAGYVDCALAAGFRAGANLALKQLITDTTEF